MKTYQYWVFDLDGTLVDSHSNYFEILRNVFAKRGVSLSDSDCRSSLTMHRDRYIAKFFPESEIKAIAAEIQSQSDLGANVIQVFPGIEGTLDHLQSQGKKLALWTGRDYQSAHLILQKTGLEKYFEKFVSGTCTIHHKPHPEGLSRIMKEWQSEPASTLMIGDHDVDIHAAREVQVSSVRVSWAFQTPPACRIANYHFYQTKDFHSWVQTK